MKMNDSQQLLADYLKNGSETAFRELVARYINLVHSTANRLAHGDAHLAQDITQNVFITLARKARTLPPDVMLGGWLHRATCLLAASTMRGERRRALREREAVAMNLPQDHTAANLAQVAPVLDEAINELEPEDRTAILLRFFEQQEFRAVGEALGSSEDAARMRVSRALDKLNVLLRKRGLSFSAVALGVTLTAGAVTAAPADLATVVAGTALASGAGGGVAASIFKFVTTTKLRAGVASAAIVAALVVPAVIARQSFVKLRQENLSLQQQAGLLAPLQAENIRLSNLVAQANARRALTEDEVRQLAKLRDEVGRLRELTNKMASAPPEVSPILPRAVSRRGQGVPVNGIRSFHEVTMAEFSRFVSGVMKVPVVDQTGLTGIYDIEMTAPRQNVADGRIERVTGILLNDLGLQLVPFTGPFTAEEERAASSGPVRLVKLTNGLFTNINAPAKAPVQGFALRFDHPDAPGLKISTNATGTNALAAGESTGMEDQTVGLYTPDLPAGIFNKLKLINAAKNEWALGQGKGYTNAPTWEELQFYLGSGPTKDMSRFTNSPDGTYIIGAMDEKPRFRSNAIPALEKGSAGP
jgi:RNA polymerase sigma factor (sigma-70 family)